MSEVQQPDQHPDAATTGIRRRSLFGAAAVTAGVVVAGQAPASAGRGQPAARDRATPSCAGSPPRLGRRPPGSAGGGRTVLVDPKEVAREVDQVAAAGFGALEIADVTHSLVGARDHHRPGEAGLGHGRPGSPGSRPRSTGPPATGSGSTSPSARPGRRRYPPSPPTTRRRAPSSRTVRSVVAGGTTYDGRAARPGRRPRVRAAPKRHLVAVQALRTVGAPVKAVADARPHVVRRPHRRRRRRTAHLDRSRRRVVGAPRPLAPRLGRRSPRPARTPSPRSYVVDHFSAAGSGAVIDFWKHQHPRLAHCVGCWRRPGATSSRTRWRSRPTRPSGRRGCSTEFRAACGLRPPARSSRSSSR